jgi:cation:H+ antiporter
MAIGNIVGSNIFNILFIVGLSGMVIPVPFAPPFRFDMIFAAGTMLLLLLLSLPNRRLGRVDGFILVMGYIAYFWTIL